MNLSLTQKFYICIVNEKGVLSSTNQKAAACLVTSCLLEMKLQKCISLDNKKVTVCGNLPKNMSYLQPLYNMINQNKSLKINKVVEKYVFSFSEKDFKELLNSIVESLKKMNLVQPVSSGLFGKKISLAPKKEIINLIINEIRIAIFENGMITEDVVALTALLDKAGRLKDYFWQYDKKELKARLSGIRNSEDGRTVKDIIDYIDSIFVAVFACTCI